MGCLTFVSEDEESSVYTAVAEFLLKHRHRTWRRLPSRRFPFQLCLGQRNNIQYARLGDPQTVNYYRGHGCLCRKAALTSTLRNHLPDVLWFPQTFAIYPSIKPQDSGFRARAGIAQGSVQTHHKDESDEFLRVCKEEAGRIWIVKATAGAKGKGIFLSKDPEEILNHIKEQSYAFVVQQYIENPFLLHGQRKFDLRCWVLLDHNYDIYLFKEGVLRTSSENYDLSNLGDLLGHVTNHSLQEQLSRNYGKYEEGNEIFFDEFDRYLRTHCDTALDQDIMPQVTDIILQSLLAVKQHLSTEGLDYKSFQLLGFDFLLDANMKIWLLEVNGAPACAQKLLPCLVRSLVQTAVDTIYCPDPEDVANEVSTDLFIKIT